VRPDSRRFHKHVSFEPSPFAQLAAPVEDAISLDTSLLSSFASKAKMAEESLQALALRRSKGFNTQAADRASAALHGECV
jgi:hypothetical protein